MELGDPFARKRGNPYSFGCRRCCCSPVAWRGWPPDPRACCGSWAPCWAWSSRSVDRRGDPAASAQRRRDRGAGAGRCPGGRRAVRRGGDHGDAGQRSAAGGPRGRAGAAGAEPAGAAGPAHGPPASAGRGRGGAGRPGRRRRPAAGGRRARSCRWTAGSRRPRVLDESALTGESLPVERPAGEDVRSGVVNAGQPSTCSPRRRPPSRRTRAWCAWSSRRRRPRPRSSAPPTASPSPSCRSPCCSRGRAGRSAGTRYGPWPCSSSRRRARCCWPPRSRSCPGCPGPRGPGWSSRAAGRWNGWPPGGSCSSTRPAPSPRAARRGRRGHRRRAVDADEVLRLAACSTRCPRTCWPARSSPRPPGRGLALAMPQDVARGARLRGRGPRRRPPGRGSARPPGSWARPPRPGCARCAAGPTWTAR